MPEIKDWEENDKGYSKVPSYRKYTMGIEEAANYYGIGTRKLRQLVEEHPNGEFYLEIGKKILIKRQQFERFLDESTSL